MDNELNELYDKFIKASEEIYRHRHRTIPKVLYVHKEFIDEIRKQIPETTDSTIFVFDGIELREVPDILWPPNKSKLEFLIDPLKGDLNNALYSM